MIPELMQNFLISVINFDSLVFTAFSESQDLNLLLGSADLLRGNQTTLSRSRMTSLWLALADQQRPMTMTENEKRQ